MKWRRVLVAGLAVTIFNMIFRAATCGGVFNWVYQLPPTEVWRSLVGMNTFLFMLFSFLLNIILVLVYLLLKNGLPGNNRLVKGLVFGLFVWFVGILPGMYSTYIFMNIATTVVIYWTILGLVTSPLQGFIIAAIYGE